MNFEQDIKMMLQAQAEGVAAAPVVPDATMRRVRVRKTLQAGGITLAVAGVAVAGLFVRSAVWTDATPPQPADNPPREIVPMHNGRFLAAGDSSTWVEDTAPPRPGVGAWAAFDQGTGSFLFLSRPLLDRIWVIGEDRLIAEFDCPPSAVCEDITGDLGLFHYDLKPAFGPGPAEVTVPARPVDGRESLQVLGFDGTVRDTLDISPVVSQGQQLSDLAWSPDGSLLAVGTEVAQPCDESEFPCEAKIWIFDRDGGEPQLVYTARAADDALAEDAGNPMLVHMTWSPDARSLAVISTPSNLMLEPEKIVWPRLVVLRLAEPVRTETLHVYDDYDWGRDPLFPGHHDTHFAFAWSPDGTRIAVTSEGGVAEISAEDGHVLTRHPGEQVHGPLAWLPKR